MRHLRWIFPAMIALALQPVPGGMVRAASPGVGATSGSASSSGAGDSCRLRFEVTLRPGIVASPQEGRLLILLGQAAEPEPRLGIGLPDEDDTPVFGRDVRNLRPGGSVEVDCRAAAYPVSSLAELPAGDYYAQALLAVNRDLRGVNRPGDLYSLPVKAHLDPARKDRLRLELVAKEPPETMPPDTEFIRYVKIPSRILSEFHHRPVELRAGVILPRDYGKIAGLLPLWVHIGGYGERYTSAGEWMKEGSEFRKLWADPALPAMLIVHLDGAGPFGDPYQVNSANNGPYGDAVTQELIPYVEEKFHGLGTSSSRVLEGESTGGWVALALQIYYPDVFSGAWSFCPDGVDFRAFQLLNIYSDDNAYVNARGFERPSARDAGGDVLFTMRREVQLENVLGAGDSWTLSGGQWGAWNAVYGPKGADGMPARLWDPATGRIDHAVAEAWKKYDLRLFLQQHWSDLAPRLKGRIHIWVGDADTFFLNNAVHLLDAFFAEASPAYEGSITFGPGKEHCWVGISQQALMAQMAAAVGASEKPGVGQVLMRGAKP